PPPTSPPTPTPSTLSPGSPSPRWSWPACSSPTAPSAAPSSPSTKPPTFCAQRRIQSQSPATTQPRCFKHQPQPSPAPPPPPPPNTFLGATWTIWVLNFGCWRPLCLGNSWPTSPWPIWYLCSCVLDLLGG